jgi:uncharacterized membrane protein YhaH (DUF805 family)
MNNVTLRHVRATIVAVVALVTMHAMRMHSIVISGLLCFTIFFQIISEMHISEKKGY